MSELSDFLINNYYSKYHGTRTDIIPTIEQIEEGFIRHKDRFVIVRDDKIRGVAIFLSLSDETYAKLKEYDITKVDVLIRLFEEYGPNVHFVLLCADGTKTIMQGIKEVKKRVKPKTISWWNPDLTYLHKYIIKEE